VPTSGKLNASRESVRSEAAGGGGAPKGTFDWSPHKREGYAALQPGSLRKKRKQQHKLIGERL